MRILVSGATGFIGRNLVERLLARGDAVSGFTRKKDAPGLDQRVGWLGWDPGADGEWQAAIAGHDAIVHLAGEVAASRRYSERVRREIRASRVGSTERLVAAMERAEPRPRVFVCASGVGYYGAHGEEPLDESAPPGNDFLAEVCVEWEAAARRAEAFGVRVVSLRIGFVLGRDGGALARLVPIFKAFAGGPLGNGRQMMSWIHIDDLVGAMLYAIDEARLAGPVNCAAPNAVNNGELTRTLGHVLSRPAIVPAPAFALRALFGDGAQPLLTGQRAVPKKLLEAGYEFRFVVLETALRDLVD